MAVVLAACATPAFDDLGTAHVSVGDRNLTVAVADDVGERRQGLQGVDALPTGIDGMLFVFDEPTSTSFHMRTVGLPLDVWWFDAEGRLIGSAQMETCPVEECVSYPTPGPISWALETPADEMDLLPGAVLTVES